MPLHKTNGFAKKKYDYIYTMLNANSLRTLVNFSLKIYSVGYTWAKGCSGGAKANQLEVGPGLALNVSNNVSLIGKFGFLGYQNTKTDVVTEAGKGSVKTNSFGLDLDMRNIQFGAIVKF